MTKDDAARFWKCGQETAQRRTIMIGPGSGISGGGRPYVLAHGNIEYAPEDMNTEAQLAWVAGFLAGAKSYQPLENDDAS